MEVARHEFRHQFHSFVSCNSGAVDTAMIALITLDRLLPEQVETAGLATASSKSCE